MKRTRRIEIVQYRRLIVTEGLGPVADPTAGSTAVNVILKKLSGVPPPETVDDDGLAEDNEVADDRLLVLAKSIYTRQFESMLRHTYNLPDSAGLEVAGILVRFHL